MLAKLLGASRCPLDEARRGNRARQRSLLHRHLDEFPEVEGKSDHCDGMEAQQSSTLSGKRRGTPAQFKDREDNFVTHSYVMKDFIVGL